MYSFPAPVPGVQQPTAVCSVPGLPPTAVPRLPARARLRELSAARSQMSAGLLLPFPIAKLGQGLLGWSCCGAPSAAAWEVPAQPAGAEPRPTAQHRPAVGAGSVRKASALRLAEGRRASAWDSWGVVAQHDLDRGQGG